MKSSYLGERQFRQNTNNNSNQAKPLSKYTSPNLIHQQQQQQQQGSSILTHMKYSKFNNNSTHTYEKKPLKTQKSSLTTTATTTAVTGTTGVGLGLGIRAGMTVSTGIIGVTGITGVTHKDKLSISSNIGTDIHMEYNHNTEASSNHASDNANALKTKTQCKGQAKSSVISFKPNDGGINTKLNTNNDNSNKGRIFKAKKNTLTLNDSMILQFDENINPNIHGVATHRFSDIYKPSKFLKSDDMLPIPETTKATYYSTNNNNTNTSNHNNNQNPQKFFPSNTSAKKMHARHKSEAQAGNNNILPIVNSQMNKIITTEETYSSTCPKEGIESEKIQQNNIVDTIENSTNSWSFQTHYKTSRSKIQKIGGDNADDVENITPKKLKPSPTLDNEMNLLSREVKDQEMEISDKKSDVILSTQLDDNISSMKFANLKIDSVDNNHDKSTNHPNAKDATIQMTFHDENMVLDPHNNNIIRNHIDLALKKRNEKAKPSHLMNHSSIITGIGNNNNSNANANSMGNQRSESMISHNGGLKNKEKLGVIPNDIQDKVYKDIKLTNENLNKNQEIKANENGQSFLETNHKMMICIENLTSNPNKNHPNPTMTRSLCNPISNPSLIHGIDIKKKTEFSHKTLQSNNSNNNNNNIIILHTIKTSNESNTESTYITHNDSNPLECEESLGSGNHSIMNTNLIGIGLQHNNNNHILHCNETLRIGPNQVKENRMILPILNRTKGNNNGSLYMIKGMNDMNRLLGNNNGIVGENEGICDSRRESKQICQEQQQQQGQKVLSDIEKYLIDDANNPTSISDDIFNKMLEKDQDKDYYIDPNYFGKVQTTINWLMRVILMDWMMEVCCEFSISRETFYIAIHYVDQYLSINPGIEKWNLQLVGVAALFLASKMEEVTPHRLKDFAKSADNAYTPEKIMEMEISMLKSLKWKLNPQTIYNWSNFLMIAWDIFINDNTTQEISQYLEKYPVRPYFKRLNEQSFILYRQLIQYIDCAILHIDTLLYQKQMLVTSFMYLILGKYYGIFTDYYIVNQIVNVDITTANRDLQGFNEIFGLFIKNCSCFELNDMLDTIRYCSQYFRLPINYELPPIVKRESNMLINGSYEDFLSYQTYTKDNMILVKSLGKRVSSM